MAGRRVSPGLKMALELGPIAAFFVAYLRLKDETFMLAGAEYSGFIVVTAAFIPLLLLTTGILWRLTGHLSRMQAVTAVLVMVFGGLSVWLNDERFFKMKPTIIYLLFGGALGLGLLRGKSWLELVMSEALPMSRQGWMILTRRVMLFFFAMAAANEIVWRAMSTDAWVSFKTFGLPGAVFAFFLAQSGLFRRHGIAERKGGE